MVFAKGKRSAVGPTAVSRRTCWILADSQGFSPSKDIKCDNLFKTADHGQYSAKIYHMLPKHLPAVESLTPAVREVSVGLWIEWLLSHSSRKGVLFNGCFALVRKMCEGEKSPVTGVFFHTIQMSTNRDSCDAQWSTKSIHSSTGVVSTVLSSSSHKKLWSEFGMLTLACDRSQLSTNDPHNNSLFLCSQSEIRCGFAFGPSQRVSYLYLILGWCCNVLENGQVFHNSSTS